MNEATFVTEIMVIDPDTNAYVAISIFKSDNGGMFGLDSSYIEQMFEDDGDVIIPNPFADNNSLDNIILKGV